MLESVSPCANGVGVIVKRPKSSPQLKRSQSELDLAAELAVYVGSEEHKAKRWWGGLPAVRKRRDGRIRRPKKQRTTVCHLVSEEDRLRATRWIREAIRKGRCRFVDGDGQFPKHVWHTDDDGGHWRGLCVNAEKGEYKGWPATGEEMP